MCDDPFVIKKDGDAVGMVTDPVLAEHIDGVELSNDASDPAYREVSQYETERGSEVL